jgi:sporulation protein YlmC with PRC-barrel domain
MAAYDDYRTRGDDRSSQGDWRRDQHSGRSTYGRGEAYGGRGSFDERGSYGRSDRGDSRFSGSYGRSGRDSYRSSGAYDRGGRDNERFYNMDEDRDLAIDETDRLISSSKVEGTRVYSRRGERLGTVESFMVDKRSGRVEYAVLSFGGFLGLGNRHYPLPWNMLTYDTNQGGYVVDLDPRELEHAPSFAAGSDHRFGGGYQQHVDRYYGIY